MPPHDHHGPTLYDDHRLPAARVARAELALAWRVGRMYAAKTEASAPKAQVAPVA
jgi:hypothetical protein